MKHTRNSYVSISCIQRDISVINAHKVNGKHRSRRTGQPRRRRPRAQNVIRFSTSRDHDAGANASGPTRPLRARVYEREHSTVGSSPRYATTVVETTRPVSKIRDERARWIDSDPVTARLSWNDSLTDTSCVVRGLECPAPHATNRQPRRHRENPSSRKTILRRGREPPGPSGVSSASAGCRKSRKAGLSRFSDVPGPWGCAALSRKQHTRGPWKIEKNARVCQWTLLRTRGPENANGVVRRELATWRARDQNARGRRRCRGTGIEPWPTWASLSSGGYERDAFTRRSAETTRSPWNVRIRFLFYCYCFFTF